MKKLNFLFCFILTLILTSFSINAAESNSTVKVGLSNYTNLENININNTNLQVGFEKDNNFNLIYSLNSNSGVNIKNLNSIYIKLSKSFSSYIDALTYIQENKISTNAFATVVDDFNWSIYIGGFSSQSTAENFVYQNDLTCSIINSKNALGIYLNDNLLFIFDAENYNLQLKSNDFLKINNLTYRGTIEFKNKSKTFSLINILNIEEYLYGVVPSEMPSSWNIEALKAQSVASRSYTYNMIKNSSHHLDGYDLCDTTHCQVYKGSSEEQTTSTNAVNATSGIMAYYNNYPINAFYYSSNGGFTEDSINVWGNSSPYLNSFEDNYETGVNSWERTFTFDELTSLASTIGEVHTITLNFYENSPRVSSLIISGKNGSKILEKENIRTFFSKSSDGSLNSRNFTILNTSNSNISNLDYNNLHIITSKDLSNFNLLSVNVINNTNKIHTVNSSNLSIITNNSQNIYNNTAKSISISKNDTYAITFLGKGYGHGVGMSQHGANSMASLGYSYIDILKFYYKGIEVK